MSGKGREVEVGGGEQPKGQSCGTKSLIVMSEPISGKVVSEWVIL